MNASVPTLMSGIGGGDGWGGSQVTAGFDEVSREQLDKIKARTMYNMVEPIDGGTKKVLFLTNNQATLLAKESADSGRFSTGGIASLWCRRRRVNRSTS